MRSGTTSLTQRLGTFALALLCASPAAAICDFSSVPTPTRLCGHLTVARGQVLGPGEHSLGEVPEGGLVLQIRAWAGVQQDGFDDGATVLLLEDTAFERRGLDLTTRPAEEVMVFLGEGTYRIVLAIEDDNVLLTNEFDPDPDGTVVSVDDVFRLSVDRDVQNCLGEIYTAAEPDIVPRDTTCNDQPGACSQGPGAAIGALSLLLLLLRRRR